MNNIKNVVLNSWDFIENEYSIPSGVVGGKLSYASLGAAGAVCAAGIVGPVGAAAIAVGSASKKIADVFTKKKKIDKTEIPDELFKNECAVFYQKLCQYCDEMNISESELYNRARVSRAVFSNIRSMSQKSYLPSKLTIMCLCIALHLELEKTQELLAILGYSLSNKIIIDKVVAWCLEQHDLNFDVDSINDVIYEKTDGKYCLLKAS